MTDDDRPVAVIACDEAEIAFWPDHCPGCLVRFETLSALESHRVTCHADRDRIVAEKLARQARDDGRIADAEEIETEHLL